MKKSIIEKYISKINELLNEDVYFNYYISFGNIYSPEWRKLEDSHISMVKNDDGLSIRLLSKKTFQTFNNSSLGTEFPMIISRFTLIQMPGCCGIYISTEVEVDLNYRNKGLNTLLNNMRLELAKKAGYTIIMCTDLVNNIAERKTLYKNNWKDIHFFTNHRTGNELGISIKEL